MAKSYTYSEYKVLFENLVEAQTSTGNNPSEDLIKYTKLNWSRAKRGDKTFVALPETQLFLNNLKKSFKLLIITEPWCGDAAQVVPAIAGIAKESSLLDVEIVLRDENDDLMSRYLTNGGKAIPIVVIIEKDTGKELGSWGPRPAKAQDQVLAYKAKPETERESYFEFVQNMQKWYNKDKTASIQKEFIQKLKNYL